MKIFAGARADQLLLRDIIISRLLKNSIFHPYGGHRNSVRSFGVRTPNVTRTASSISLPTNMASDQTIEELIDEITNSLTLNWFLSLFHQALPLQVRRHSFDVSIFVAPSFETSNFEKLFSVTPSFETLTFTIQNFLFIL